MGARSNGKVTRTVGGGSDPGPAGARPDSGLLTKVPAAGRGRPPVGRWDRLKAWLRADEPLEPVPSYVGVLEEPVPARYGICLSGGGIRSAAFNLGALQALQGPERILQRATYLSAVSGGSYIAAGFAMVAKVTDPRTDSDKRLLDDLPPFAPGSPEEQYLRNRCAYMAPGFTGKARLVARVALGVLVNLLFLGALLGLLGWAAGWGYEAMHGGLARPDGDAHVTISAGAALGILVLGVAGGLLSSLVRLKPGRRARALNVWSGRLTVLAVLVGVAFVGLPALLEWLRETGESENGLSDTAGTVVGVGGGTGTVTLLLAVLLQLRTRLMEHARLTRTVENVGRRLLRDRVLPRLRSGLALLAVAAAGPLLLGGIFVLAALASLVHDGTEPWWLLGAAAAWCAGLLLFGDVTTWSLHPFYKRRLCKAFALRRVEDRDGNTIAEERPYGTIVPLSASGVEPVADDEKANEWPLLVVCAAANVSDPGATPPGRAVTSFTFSPRAVGSPLIGAAETTAFEQLEPRARDFSLPAAVAMSGAALSPSMGKATRRSLRFLLTLANARLGVWVPNPRRFADEKVSELAGLKRWLYWRPRPTLLFNELIGRNSADAKFLYVTDGGHYENLGLVELLRRGCTDVLCFDASGGRDVQELGDAIALARSELQVEIEIDPAPVVPDPATGVAGSSCVQGTIRYPSGATGTLVYVRSVMTAAAPHDVRAYQEIDPQFPHNSTGEQLYTDQRFEAYRALGHEAGRRAVALFEVRRRARRAPGQGTGGAANGALLARR